MRVSWRWLPWLALVAIAVAVLVIGTQRTGHPSLQERTMHVAAQVRCPVCEGQSAAESQAPASVQIRDQIQQELAAGESQGQILSSLVAAYGPGILEKPEARGAGLVLWVLPVLAVAAAIAGVALAFGRGGGPGALPRYRLPSGSWWNRLCVTPAAAKTATVMSPANGAPVRLPPMVASPGRVMMGPDSASPPGTVSASPPGIDSASPPGVGPQPRLALEEERDFCLRSLRDLEAEHSAGDLDDADYRTLWDSYVARAAAALRQLDPGKSADNPGAGSQDETGRLQLAGVSPGDLPVESPATPEHDGSAPAATNRSSVSGARRRSWRTRLLVGAGVLAATAGAAWGVVASSATRLPGEEITGQAVGSVAMAQSLQAAQQATARGDALTAVKDYQKVLQSDPGQPQALTGEGWILAQTQQPALLQQGLTMLAGAEQSDPTYAPAHLYRGIALLSEDDYTGAIPELQWYLGHDPDPQLAARVRTALQQAQAKAGAAKKG